MIRLLLCRHGQSEADLEPRRIEGSADFSLTELGQRQSLALASWLAPRYQVDRILTSPLLRARQTAAAIQKATGAPLEVEPRLAERSSGLLAGLTRAEADARYPVTHPLPMYHRPPEGESYLDQFRRVADWYFPFWHDTALDGSTQLVVTHGGTLKCLLDAALGLPPMAPVAFACADTCLHELHLTPGTGVRVVRFNYTVHLEGLT